MNGAKAFSKEMHRCQKESNPDMRIIVDKEGVYLEITLPEEMFKLTTELITGEKLEMVRIANAPYENPDGSEVVLNQDLLGNRRGSVPTPGPIEALHGGKNIVKIWEKPFNKCPLLPGI